MAVHAALIGRDLFLAYFYPSGPFTCNINVASEDTKENNINNDNNIQAKNKTL